MSGMNNPYPELAEVLSAEAPSSADLDSAPTGRNMAFTAVLPAAPSIGLSKAATAVSSRAVAVWKSSQGWANSSARSTSAGSCARLVCRITWRTVGSAARSSATTARRSWSLQP